MSNEVNNFMVVIRSLLLLLVVVKLTAPLVGGSTALMNSKLMYSIVNTAGCWALVVKIDLLSAQCPPNAFAGRWALSRSNERSIKQSKALSIPRCFSGGRRKSQYFSKM